MDKAFNPTAIETHWYQTWEARGYFAPAAEGQPYCIMIPPPNVTGSLHMGHGFQESIMDALIRHQRMQGRAVLWQVGTDHAGIATQMVVERLLEGEGQRRQELGREAFLERVWEWKAESGGHITRQLRRLGASPDWSRERFTMDDGFYRAVQTAFIDLYKAGLIYRGQRLVNWDPKLHTAISDLEVVSEEETGSLWHFRYPLVGGDGALVVATTRPETLLGDAAVAVHPDDERYRHLIGREVELPLTGRTIPIIADTYVDPAFGTGCVKITPAHDFNDYAVGQRHNLPLINVFDASAHLNGNAPAAYRGMERFAARERVVADMEAAGLLEKIEPHKLKVPRGDRSGVVVEPWLTDQWYVKTAPLAGPAIEAVESGAIQFVPKQYENMYFSWMRDIQDWCISRQLWWGHRIPAWYDDAGNVYVGENEAAVRAAHQLGASVALRQDDDVLDTWFSSALWTFGTLGWPEKTPELERFHPTDVLVTGFDIIFFWVARMIMMTLHFTGEVPFKTVYVHGLVRDAQGQKMSKSKGNVLDPIDLIDGIDLDTLVAKRTRGLMNPKAAPKIEKATRKEFPDGIAPYGTDALRFTYYSLASTGRDINFDVGRIEGFRNFCNKLWNATAFVLGQCEGEATGTGDEAFELGLAERWIISRLQQAEAKVAEGFATYRLDLASQALYDFVWKDYCDWYIELTKPVLGNPDAPAPLKVGARRTLLRVLEAALRLAHPLMPFITEDLWQRVKGPAGASGESICLAPYPICDSDRIDSGALSDMATLQAVITAVRNLRGEMNLSPGRKLPLLLRGGPRALLERHAVLIERLAGTQTAQWLDADTAAPLSATAVVGALEINVPMAGLIDKTQELARLDKELERLEAELARIEAKLGNPAFAEKAPAEVVAKEREKSEAASRARSALRAKREEIAAL